MVRRSRGHRLINWHWKRLESVFFSRLQCERKSGRLFRGQLSVRVGEKCGVVCHYIKWHYFADKMCLYVKPFRQTTSCPHRFVLKLFVLFNVLALWPLCAYLYV